MSTVINRLSTTAAALGSYLTHRRDREMLLKLDDRQLADIGISRELLDSGVTAWPWKVNVEDQTVRFATGRLEAAVAELEAYSDHELADLGLSRGSIRSAVFNGRPGIDGAVNDNSADAARAA